MMTNGLTATEAIAPSSERETERLAKTDRVYFMVTCHGWSGSHWLACALGHHTDITCAHSARNLVATRENYAGGELENSVHDRQKSRLARSERRIDDYYDELEGVAETSAYGTVHTFRLRDLPVQERLGTVQRDVSLLNLVRHPASLVNSGFGQLRGMIEYDVYTLIDVAQSIHNFRDFFVDLEEKHHLNLCEKDVLCFLGAAYHLVHLGKDLRAVPTAQHVMMERATTDPAYFESVVRCLTDNRVTVDRAYIDEAFGMGEVNSHRVGRPKTPAERYASWHPWQREAFEYCLEKSKILSTYAELGYDFSFLSTS